MLVQEVFKRRPGGGGGAGAGGAVKYIVTRYKTECSINSSAAEAIWLYK